jgi:AbrB family looped-hinge helix DNA binding protein
MTTVYAKLTSKGQITLPISLRNAWDLKPGDQIAFDIEDGAKASIAPKKRRSILDSIERLTIRSGQRLTNEELKDTVENAAVEKFERSRQQDRK